MSVHNLVFLLSLSNDYFSIVQNKVVYRKEKTYCKSSRPYYIIGCGHSIDYSINRGKVDLINWID